jgi:hypothetical protein
MIVNEIEWVSIAITLLTCIQKYSVQILAGWSAILTEGFRDFTLSVNANAYILP